jgi:hypothetical protein
MLLPPENLRGYGQPHTWPREIAKAHFDWFMSIRERRIEIILDFFYATRPSRGSEYGFLSSLGAAVAEAICLQPNYRVVAGARELTAPGLAMAYDIAILVAELIIETSAGVVRWKLQSKRPTSVEFNLPVLTGRPPRCFFDPVGGSIVEAKAILRGQESGDIWAKTYSFWLDRLTKDVVVPRAGKAVNG